MGKIYTSYFAKASQFDDNKFIKVAISNSNPIDLPVLSILVPDWNTIVSPHKSGLISDEDYEERYLNQLNSNSESIKTIIRHLLDFSKDIVLMCYESPNKFCHRKLLAKWVNKNLDYNIEEYNFNKN